MKTITYLILGITLFSFNLSEAQPQAQAIQMDTIYIRKKPVPAYVEVRYYYYPNLQAYFDTKIAMYYTQKNGVWTKSETIDPTSRGYSLKNNFYVMLKGVTDDEPWANIEEHKLKYPADFSSRPKPKVNTSIASLDL